ncbi:AAA family ATPase [Brachybacterium kimchii]|uniref:AAA family ATPase n=1 Tax=Brachybacterium kimchii TaxID=2942909 RepID=A0ABY4N7Y4_9MICO|nr:AAA family ATPase [Brachybacterium kimchii]UQN30663.1 AAA family ATPase [Brachybacterium kimchii]
MTVRLVTGPPCAGKSSFVREHAAPGDLVVDYDDILTSLGGDRADRDGPRRGAADMVRAALEKHLPSDRDAWVIRTLPDPAERHAHAARIGADEVLVLTAPAPDLKRRARDAGRPEWTADVIDTWWDRYRAHDDDHSPDMGPTPTGDTSAMHRTTLSRAQQTGALNFATSPETDPAGAGDGDGTEEPKDGTGDSGEAPKEEQPKPKPRAKPEAPAGPDLGYPVGTPTADMTPDQRAAYWKFQAFKHDDEALAAKSPEEREAYWRSLARTAESANKRGPGYVAGLEASAQEAAQAELSAEDRTVLEQQSKLVRYAVKAQLPGVSAEDFDVLMGVLNPQALIGEDGDPDEQQIEKIGALVQREPRRQQHGGQRDPGEGSAAEDARERYNRRFRNKNRSR